MKNFKKINQIINLHRDELKSRFKVKRIGVFGSYARGEQDEKSDIDILVEFYGGGIGYFEFCDLEDYLKKLLKVKKIDLVTRGALKPAIGKCILSEVRYV
ncbi:MAG: nucleotidyltransferase family protein [Candidatus Goldiibacteriota bacterium]